MKNSSGFCAVFLLVATVIGLALAGAFNSFDDKSGTTNNLWGVALLIVGAIFVLFFLLGGGGSPRMSHGGMYSIFGFFWTLFCWGFVAILMFSGPEPGYLPATPLERISASIIPFLFGVPGFLIFLDGSTGILRTFKDYYDSSGVVRSGADESPSLSLGRILVLLVVLCGVFGLTAMFELIFNGV